MNIKKQMAALSKTNAAKDFEVGDVVCVFTPASGLFCFGVVEESQNHYYPLEVNGLSYTRKGIFNLSENFRRLFTLHEAKGMKIDIPKQFLVENETEIPAIYGNDFNMLVDTFWKNENN